MNKFLISAAFIFMLSGCAANAQIANGVPAQVRDTSLGKVLVSEDGMTLLVVRYCLNNCPGHISRGSRT